MPGKKIENFQNHTIDYHFGHLMNTRVFNLDFDYLARKGIDAVKLIVKGDLINVFLTNLLKCKRMARGGFETQSSGTTMYISR